MPNRPRLSLLDLFDPLLADAIRVPIPESPPSTPTIPQKPPDHSADNKENVAPKELTTSVFFNHTSRTPFQKPRNGSGISLGPLVDLEDPEDRTVGVGGEKGQFSMRTPLSELCVDGFVTPATSRLIYGSPKRNLVSHNQSRSPLAFPPQPLASHHLPSLSVLDSSQPADDFKPVPDLLVDPALPKELQLLRSPGEAPPNVLMRTARDSDSRLILSSRRSSLDISNILSPFSSGSFDVPDVSFDLVNGDISFLSKLNSEEEDAGQEVFTRRLDRKTLTVMLPQQTFITEENPLDVTGMRAYPISSRGWEESSSPLSSFTGADGYDEQQHPVFHKIPLDTAIPSQSNISAATLNLTTGVISPSLTHTRQRTLSAVSSSSAAPIRGGRIVVEDCAAMSSSRVSPVSLQGQETPLSARISSVPAPIKKLFTSGHQRAKMASGTQTVAAGIPEAAKAAPRAITLKTSPKAGICSSNSSTTFSGRARRVPTIHGIAEKHHVRPAVLKQSLSTNSTATNLRASIHPTRSTDPALHKPSPRITNTSTTVSKLPCPAGSGQNALPKQAAGSRLPAPSQGVSRGRGIPVRPSSKIFIADRVTEG